MAEEFKTVEKFPYYLVSNLGNVFSLYTNKLLKPQKQNNGYLTVTLCHKKKKKMFSVHRLVSILFVKNRGKHQNVNHRNGIKEDNRAENLEWISQSENVSHAYRLGLRIIDEEHKKRCAQLGKKWKGVKRCQK